MTSLVVACAICLANADSPLLDAARAGVLVLALVTCGVLGAFARWFIRLAQRSVEDEERK